MEITFHGAAHTVTGSQHLLKVNGRRILLDCGLYQGRRDESTDRNRNLPFDATQVDTLILSHAHIDHSGNIPNLVQVRLQGRIITTSATRDLCSIMLRDSAKIQELDVDYLNKKRRRDKLPPLEPIYTTADAVASLKQFIGINYERPYEVAPGVTLTFYDAGHVLGSAIVALDIEEDPGGRPTRLVFSGDLGRARRPILNDPVFLDEADILILESTYGDREHPDDEDTDHRLEEIIRDTIKQGGKVIVPAFAVGRTQELVYRLNNLVERRDLPANLQVYVDSPLAIDVTQVFRSHPEAYDDEIAEVLLTDRDRDPFGFSMMRYTRSAEESKELNFLRQPAVIISASGMAEVGRILHHLKNNIEDPRSSNPHHRLPGRAHARPAAGGGREAGENLRRGLRRAGARRRAKRVERSRRPLGTAGLGAASEAAAATDLPRPRRARRGYGPGRQPERPTRLPPGPRTGDAPAVHPLRSVCRRLADIFRREGAHLRCRRPLPAYAPTWRGANTQVCSLRDQPPTRGRPC